MTVSIGKLITLDMHSSRTNERQRTDNTPLSLSHLPVNVLSNCFSFLGPSGNYYFLASVCKDFKVAVDELYGDDRNTCMDSILTSVSTCTHVMTLLFDENGLTLMKVVAAVFENDRLDLYRRISSKLSIRTLQDDLTDVTSAIRHNSTEIMRSIIANEQIIYLLKNKEPPTGIEIKPTNEEMESIVQAIPSACDPQMVHQLVEKGVVFKNGLPILHSLRRKDLETFKCLLDILEHEELKMEQKVILQTLQHEMHLDAIKYLKQKGYFNNEDVFVTTILYIIQTKKEASINILKTLFDSRDISDHCINLIIVICINEECMDILSYIHDSIQRIDIDFWIHYAEMNNMIEVVAHLQSMQ